MFHLHLNSRGHGCPMSWAGVEGSVLPQKLFAAVNTGSFHKSMTGTRVSFTLTNKLLTAIKNDSIISGKNSSLKLTGEIDRWEEKKSKMIMYENSTAFQLRSEKLNNIFYCLSMKELNKTSYCNCFLTTGFSINSICILITALKLSEFTLLHTVSLQPFSILLIKPACH